VQSINAQTKNLNYKKYLSANLINSFENHPLNWKIVPESYCQWIGVFVSINITLQLYKP